MPAVHPVEDPAGEFVQSFYIEKTCYRIRDQDTLFGPPGPGS